MKVSSLVKGMVLYLSDEEKIAWLSDDYPLPTGEVELRFAPLVMEGMLPGTTLKRDELIVYLGHDKEPVDKRDPEYKRLVRRVMVKEKTAVVMGYNFKHLEPHPNF